MSEPTFTTHDLAQRVNALALSEWDTLEAHTIRAEAVARAALDRCHLLEVELSAVDQALLWERVPLHNPGAHDLTRMTRMGRIRWLGDQRRVTAHELRRARAAQPSVLRGQMSVDDCIAEVERDV